MCPIHVVPRLDQSLHLIISLKLFVFFYLLDLCVFSLYLKCHSKNHHYNLAFDKILIIGTYARNFMIHKYYISIRNIENMLISTIDGSHAYITYLALI